MIPVRTTKGDTPMTEDMLKQLWHRYRTTHDPALAPRIAWLEWWLDVGAAEAGRAARWAD